VRLFLIILAALSLSACGVTFTPPLSHSKTIAPVGNIIDAGIIGPMYHKDGTFAGWRVRAFAVDDYNARLLAVGAKLSPPVKPNAGISTDGEFYLMTAEAMDRWQELVGGDLP
jgi:hypothetical protein